MLFFNIQLKCRITNKKILSKHFLQIIFGQRTFFDQKKFIHLFSKFYQNLLCKFSRDFGQSGFWPVGIFVSRDFGQSGFWESGFWESGFWESGFWPVGILGQSGFWPVGISGRTQFLGINLMVEIY